MTRGPAPRVAAILELFRPVVDEIVVALDDRAEPDAVAALAGLTDKLVGYPYAEPVDRPLPWLFRQCRGRWLLLWDDDEIPSREFLEAMPSLVASDDVTGYWLPRRWLYPDAASYLDLQPWRPDYQLRLVLNDLRLLRFPAENHSQLATLGPSRYLEQAVYHAQLVLNSHETRLRTAECYERLLPGKRIAGRPLNAAYYLPERDSRVTTAPLPPADAALVRQVLEAALQTAVGPVPSLQVARRQDVDRHWEGRVLGPEAYRARLELRDNPQALVAGEVRTLDALVENLGDAVWPWGDAAPEIRLAYRWWRDGEVVAEGLRTPLPADVEPGERSVVAFAVQAPERPGCYRLAVDLVHEQVRWFECGFDADVDVLPRRRLAVAGPVELDRLSELEPDLEPLVLSDDPSLHRRYAGEIAPGAGAFLLRSLPDGRASAALALGVRTARLVLSARRLHRGRIPSYGRDFLEALARCEALFVVADGDRRRERWVARATVLAARALDLRTIPS